jgi:Na+-driven multidrug efflux pump
MITVIGRCVGAQDYEQARYYAKKMMKITYIAMIAVSIFIVLLCRPIATLYNPSAETLKLAVWCAIWHSINVCLTWPMSFALPNILRAANDVKFTMTTSIVSMWTCRIAASYLLALGMGLGLKGVWIAMTLDWMVRAACFGWRFLSGKWEKKQLLS